MMRLLKNFSMLVLALCVTTYSAHAASPHTYVLSYEGAIDGDTAKIEAEIEGLFGDLDPAKVSSGILLQNYPQTNIYTIEGFFEPKTQQEVDYVEEFARNHSEFAVGNLKLRLKLAAKVAEFFSIQGFGPDQSGTNEISWGTFTRFRQFSSVAAYQSDVIELGMSLGQGNEGKIGAILLPILNPVDAKSFQEWLDGVGSAKQKLSRFHWDSRSFFVMEDGSFVSRLMSWELDRTLAGQAKP